MNKYIINEDDLRALLLAYFRNEAILYGRTNRDDIFDDFETYLNDEDILVEKFEDYDEGFNVLIDREISTFKKIRGR